MKSVLHLAVAGAIIALAQSRAAPFAGAVDARAAVTRLQFGGPDRVESSTDKKGVVKETVLGDGIVDLAVAPDGALLALGVLQDAGGVPPGVPVRRPVGGADGPAMAFVARISADLSAMEWMALLPGGAFEPRRLAVAPDGGLLLAGELGPKGAETLPAAVGDKTKAALLKLASGGGKLLWARSGGPNQMAVTGLATAPDGTVYWTAGTVGERMAAYVMQARPENGETFDFPAAGRWAIDLHPSVAALNEPGQYFSFYKRGQTEGAQDGFFDYDGAGKWEAVKFWVKGMRQNGHVLVLPDGDLIVSHTMQYDFQIRGQKKEPCFDLFLARYTKDGKLKWSTNAYREGDSVHTPDQKDVDLLYNPVTGEIVVVAWQHGSNVYRLMGDLIGDTGNIGVPWVGRFDPATGRIRGGWYFHCVKDGTEFDANGRPQKWPDITGSRLDRAAVDGAGRIWLAGQGGRHAFTTAQAGQGWPRAADGKPLWGYFGVVYALAPDLSKIDYATAVRGDARDDGKGNAAGRSGLRAIAVLPDGIVAAGSVADSGFPTPDAPAWSRRDLGDREDCAIVRLRWK
jgi:hypothetical protein